ncbi:MAG: hypothetical protein LBP57_02475 [Endomicrobium sp.]|nr:hypothetical protein [Endomicrobium sp.]
MLVNSIYTAPWQPNFNVEAVYIQKVINFEKEKIKPTLFLYLLIPPSISVADQTINLVTHSTFSVAGNGFNISTAVNYGEVRANTDEEVMIMTKDGITSQ